MNYALMALSFSMSSSSDTFDAGVSMDLLRELVECPVCGVPMPNKLDLLMYNNADAEAPGAGVLLIGS